MKAKRIAMLMFVFTVLFGATVYAESRWGTYGDYEKTRIRVDGKVMEFAEGSVPAFVVDGSTVLPLRKISETMRALVGWDGEFKTVDIHKPNVHMFFAQDVDEKDFSLKKPFAKVNAGDKIDFVVFSQVDNLNVHVDGFRISITSPSGKQVTDPLIVPLDTKETSFWYPWPFRKVAFSEAGDYTVKFEFLYNGEYRVVGEKKITAE